jgi:hypothetical protein
MQRERMHLCNRAVTRSLRGQLIDLSSVTLNADIMDARATMEAKLEL